MHKGKYVFAQLFDFIDKDVFLRLANKYDGNRYVKQFTCSTTVVPQREDIRLTEAWRILPASWTEFDGQKLTTDGDLLQLGYLADV